MEIVWGGRLADSIMPTQFPAMLTTSAGGVVGEVGLPGDGVSLDPPQLSEAMATMMPHAIPHCRDAKSIRAYFMERISPAPSRPGLP